MATAVDAKNQIAKRQEDGETTLAKMINAMKPQIALALPAHMKPDRMARIALTMVRRSPELALCTAQSFMGALMTCAQIGLEPGPLGHVWMIPRQVYENKKPTGVYEATFQLGYKGVIELARRSGQMAKVTARTVYSKEVTAGLFTVRYEGADENLVHEPILIGERGEPVLYYAMARLTSGEQTFTPLRPEDVEVRHRQRSSASNSPAWISNYEAMAWKSCIVEARKWWPQSIELEQAIAHEGSVRVDHDLDALDTPPARSDALDSESWPAPAVIPASPHQGREGTPDAQ